MHNTPHTKEARKKISEAGKGRKHTEESKRKISEAMKGRKPWSYGKKHTEETKRKMKQAHLGHSRCGWKLSKQARINISNGHKGNKSYLWKGGITQKNTLIRAGLKYRLWREAIFKRDNYTCIFCGQKSGQLNADHIKPFAHYLELRFALDNGRTLCRECHKKTDTYAGKSKKADSRPV